MVENAVMEDKQQKIINNIKNGFLELSTAMPKESRSIHYEIDVNAQMSSVHIRYIGADAKIAIMK